MAGKRKPGPLGGQTNAGNADEGGRVNPTNAGPAPSTASSVFAKALGSMESEAGAVSARLRVKAENLDRGIRNNLDGALCIYAAGVQAENYAPEAILEETGCQISTLISGILPGLMEMLKVVGATTVFGAGIGGAVGLFAGGATAAPGLVIGGELGFDVGMAALTWLGLGFLVATITEGFVELYKALHEGVEWAWQAKDMKGAAQKEQQDRAAHKMAEAAGILMRLVLQGILAELLRKAAMGTTRGALATGKAFEAQGARATADAGVAEVVGKLRASKFGNGFSDWIEKNWRDLQKNPKLQPRAAASPSQAPAAAAEGGGSGGGGGKAASSAADDSGSAAEEEKPDLSTNAKKGVFGEAKADAYMKQKGFKKLNGPDVQVGDAPRGQGIDGVYENLNPPPKYVIGEAKFGSSQLGKTQDGMQMSENWVDNRLSKAVGRRTAADILDEGYDRVLLKVDEGGNVTPKIISEDASGKVTLSNPPPGSIFSSN